MSALRSFEALSTSTLMPHPHTRRIHQTERQKKQRAYCFEPLFFIDAAYFTAHALECSLQPRVAVALVLIP
jgi:hypothetical protein